MNWDQVEGKWKQFTGNIKEKWGALTDDEIDRLEGKKDRLSGLIQEKYGKTKEEAESEINDFISKLKD